MNNVFAFRNTASTAIPNSTQAAAMLRSAALAALLKASASTEGEVLYPLLATLLEAHLDHPHDDTRANARIRDGLDNLELLLALDIERLGLRRAPETPCRQPLRLRS
ncbi:hypothetical protein D3C71_1028570 [compost metagenome]